MIDPPLPDETKSFLFRLWALARDPLSLYVRGSYSSLTKSHRPWDLDIIFVSRSQTEDFESLYARGCRLADEYPALPELDLTCITAQRLLYNEGEFLKRLLLAHEGILVRGAPLLGLPAKNKLDKDASARLCAIYHDIVRRKIDDLRTGMSQAAGPFYVAALARTLAKALLRAAATFFVTSITGEFLRDPEMCHRLSKSIYPGERELSLDMAFAIVRGENIDIARFLREAEELHRIINGNLGKWNSGR